MLAIGAMRQEITEADWAEIARHRVSASVACLRKHCNFPILLPRSNSALVPASELQISIYAHSELARLGNHRAGSRFKNSRFSNPAVPDNACGFLRRLLQ